MRSGWKKLCQLAISVLSLTFAPMAAQAQFGLGGGAFSQLPPPPAQSLRGMESGPKDPPFTMRDDGRPNAFTNLMDVQTRDSLPILPPFFKRSADRLRPGIIYPVLTPGRSAEFPNPGTLTDEPATAFTTREEGVANAFTEVRDARWNGPFTRTLQGTRLLFTELFNPPPQVFDTHIVNLRGEFLNWAITPGPVAVPLVTTNNAPTIASFGQLGDPNTTILLNSGDIANYGSIPGFRLSAEVATLYTPPIELSGFSLDRTITLFSGGSLTNPTQLLAMPFQDINPVFIIPGTTSGLETAHVVAIPVGSAVGAQGGTIDITSSMSLWGIDANVWLPICETDVIGLKVMAGYKHMTFRENIRIFTQSGGLIGGTQFNGFLLPGNTFLNQTTDTFETVNYFDGGHIGIRGMLKLQRWALIADGKFGVGSSKYELNINGTTVLVPLAPNRATQSANGGIFALETNSGTSSIASLSLTFEASVALSYQVNQAVRLYGGFNVLNWNLVARPGDYINSVIDARQVPSSASFVTGVAYTGPPPVTSVTTRSLTVTGLFLGIEIGF